MGLSDQIGLHHRYFDGITTVTFTPAGGSPIADVPALKQNIRLIDRQVYGLEFNLTTSDVVWHLWRDNGSGGGMGTTNPAAGDEIDDGTTTYIIIGAADCALTGKCKVFARPQ